MYSVGFFQTDDFFIAFKYMIQNEYCSMYKSGRLIVRMATANRPISEDMDWNS